MSSLPKPPRQKIGPAKGGAFKVRPRKLTYKEVPRESDPFCLRTIDSKILKEDLENEESLSEEDECVVDALNLSINQNHELARERAEEVLETNPANAMATYVTGLECEHRQDWSEAARFFLMGLGQNPGDLGMELGFQTNIDMLRAVRHRWINEKGPDKWEDVLSFKPRERKAMTQSHTRKPPWWRLGPLYEAILQGLPGTDASGNEAYIADLLLASADPDEERMELRRVLYQNMDFMDILYAYYQFDMAEDWPADKKVTGQLDHDGHDGDPKRFPFGRGESIPPMQLRSFVRLLKECGLIFGDAKIRILAAVIGRIHVQARRRVARMKSISKDFEVESQDPHDATMDVEFYEWIESLIRISSLHIKVSGTLSQRFETIIRKYLRPNSMKKILDKNVVEFRSIPVQTLLQEPGMNAKLRRIFEYFITSYKSNKIKMNLVGPRDLTMSFNHILYVMEKLDDFDPQYNIKKCWETYQIITCDSGLLPQEHPNNQNSEMVFEEFCEFLVRTARLKGAKGATKEILHDYLDTVTFKTGRIMPGKN